MFNIISLKENIEYHIDILRWLYTITNSMDMNLSKLWEVVEERGACSAAVHGVTKNQTRLSN